MKAFNGKDLLNIPKAIKQALRRFLGRDDELPASDLSFMSFASEAVLQQSPRGGQQLLWLGFLFLMVMLVWAGLAKVDEFSRGLGKVVPSRDIQILQNLEGGILLELLVKEGELVAKGQPLLRIDDTRFSSSYRESHLLIDHLKVKALRLKSEAEGVVFTPADYADIKDNEFVAQEISLYVSRKSELEKNQQIMHEQIAQKKQELEAVVVKRKQLFTSYGLLNDELRLTKPLIKSGAVSQVEILRLERQVNDLKGELDAAKLAVPRLESQLKEARNKKDSVLLGFQAKARAELNEVTAEFSRMNESSQALEDRVDRTVVRSPVKGMIKQLLVNTVGGVIRPGVDIVEIVPVDDSLLVEAQISPADIAFIRPGQKALVKVTAYDFAVHGGLDGEVVHISPDTIVNEDGDSFYVIRVKTENAYLGTMDKPLPIISGMIVEVNVLTGKKSILDYILKPVLKTKQLALRER